MNDLIYLSAKKLALCDLLLKDSNYEYSDWFRSTVYHGPDFVNSRVHQIRPPWPLAPTPFPLPALTTTTNNFADVMDKIAERYCQDIVATDKIPYLYWSGGIDSTSILVSLLKNNNQNFLNRLVILLNQESINENAYFYYQFIQGKLQEQDCDSFEINADNYTTISLLDGDAGNQCMGSGAINQIAYTQQYELLDDPWSDSFLKRINFNNKTLLAIVNDSINAAPIPVNTGHDYLWWINFNFKFDDVLLNKCVSYFKNLTAAQSKYFFENNLFRFYQQADMQVWSLLTTDLRREKLKITPKYFPKQYIYEFDRNDLWFSNKIESKSGAYTAWTHSTTSPVFAIDSNWQTYRLDNATTRSELGKILKRK